jgi:hypothetical protein
VSVTHTENLAQRQCDVVWLLASDLASSAGERRGRLFKLLEAGSRLDGKFILFIVMVIGVSYCLCPFDMIENTVNLVDSFYFNKTINFK